MNGAGVVAVTAQNGVITGGGYKAQAEIDPGPMSAIARLCESMMIMKETSNFNDKDWSAIMGGFPTKFNSVTLFANINKNTQQYGNIFHEYESQALQYVDIGYKSGNYKDLEISYSQYKAITFNREPDAFQFPVISKFMNAELSVIAQFDYIMLQILRKLGQNPNERYHAQNDIIKQINNSTLIETFKNFVEHTLQKMQGSEAYVIAAQQFKERLDAAQNGSTAMRLMTMDYQDAKKIGGKKRGAKKTPSLEGVKNSKAMWAFLFCQITRRLLRQVKVYDPDYSSEGGNNLDELKKAMQSIIESSEDHTSHVYTLIAFKHFFMDLSNSRSSLSFRFSKKLKILATNYLMATFGRNRNSFFENTSLKRSKTSIAEDEIAAAVNVLLEDKLDLLPETTTALAAIQYNSAGQVYVQAAAVPRPVAAETIDWSFLDELLPDLTDAGQQALPSYANQQQNYIQGNDFFEDETVQDLDTDDLGLGDLLPGEDLL